jgi:serine/threonine protein kinase
MKIVGKPLGEGSYGRVYKGIVDTLGNVAIKRLFVQEGSDFVFSIREIELGLKFEHPNLLKIKEIRTHPSKWRDRPPEGHRDDDLCLISDLAECDLYGMCDREELTEHRAKDITVQILLAVEYLHKNGYIHRDLRPANILLFKRDRIKLCDYGFCEKYHKYDDLNTTINALYFRAPELLTHNVKYGYPSDIWSIGCVMHYILTKNLIPKTLEDDDEKDFTVEEQLQSLIDGYPFNINKGVFGSDKVVKGVNFNITNTPAKFMKSYGNKIFDRKAYLSFLFDMLAFDQNERKTATQMLSHPYISKFEKSIDLTRKNCVDIGDEIKKYEVTFGSHREVLKGPCLNLFMELRKNADWYNDKTLFMGIDLYDRLLSRSPKIRVLSAENHNIYFRSCVYISSKYYSSHYLCDLNYDTFPLKEYSTQSLKAGKNFEDTILEILDYDLYRTTIYDEHMTDKVVSYRTTLSLLLFVIEGRHKDLTPTEALNLWKSEMTEYATKASTLIKEISKK